MDGDKKQYNGELYSHKEYPLSIFTPRPVEKKYISKKEENKNAFAYTYYINMIQ